MSKKTDLVEAVRITEEQEKAIELLGAGKSLAEAAREAGVGRTTMYRWLKDDPHFIAAWNAWRREQRDMARAKLTGLLSAAVDTVRGEIERGNGKLAMAVLQKMAVATAQEDGPEDPADVQRELTVKRRMEQVAIKKKESEAVLAEIVEGVR